MKSSLAAFLLVIVVSGFSLAGINHFGAGLTVNASDSLDVQLDVRYDGQASFTAEKVHTSPYSAKLVIPIGASPGSCAIALYPYNGTLNSISTFSVYASYVNATPRFVIYLDKNNDGVAESILLSDYQFASNGEWKVTTGGNRWGWTEANYQLSNYGTTWKQLDSWKNDYGNVNVLYVGIALEYWAVDPDGFGEPLYADELILDGVTNNIAPSPTVTPAPSPSPAPSSAPFKISGYILDSNGHGIGGAYIIFNDVSTPSISTDNSGYYLMPAPAGTYHVNVWPPFDSNFINYDEPGFVVGSDVTKNITLYSGYKVSGYISDSAGTPVTGAAVLLRNSAGTFGSGWFSNSMGYYFLCVPAGTYTIDAHPRTGNYYTGPTMDFPTYYEHNFIVNSNTVKNITVGGPSPSPSPTNSSNISNSDPWPMFHKDLSNSGYSESAGPLTNQILWKFQTGSSVESSPSVVDGVVYFGALWNGNNGFVYAVNATTGSKIWQYATNSGVESSPAVVDGVVYIGSYIGNVYALDAASGSKIWSFNTGGSVFPSPAVVDGMVYVGSASGYMFALNATNGSQLWSFYTSDRIFSSPAVVDGVVYFASDDKNVYALRASDGSQIWRYTTGGYVDSSLVVADGMVYLGLRGGYVYALNATDGAQIWSFLPPHGSNTGTTYYYSTPAVADGVVYVGGYDGYIYALNATTGSVFWEFRTGGYIFSSPVVAGGVLYVGSYDGNVYALDAGTGGKIWSYQTDDKMRSSCAVVNGVVYVGSGDGYLYAFGSPGAQPTSTPTTTSTSTVSSTESTESTSSSTSPSSETQQTAATNTAPAQISDPTDTDAPSSEGSVVNVSRRLSDDTPLWGLVVTVIAVGIIVTVLGICCFGVWEIRKTQTDVTHA